MEVGERGRLYTYRYTVNTRMTYALRWAAMRAILMFQKEAMDKATRQCPKTTTFLKRKESRSGIEPRSFRLPAERLTARPNRLTHFLEHEGPMYLQIVWVTPVSPIDTITIKTTEGNKPFCKVK